MSNDDGVSIPLPNGEIAKMPKMIVKGVGTFTPPTEDKFAEYKEETDTKLNSSDYFERSNVKSQGPGPTI